MWELARIQQLIALILLTLTASACSWIKPLEVSLPENRIFLGVYDRWEREFEAVTLDAEADYVSWEDTVELNEVITRIRTAKRVPLITIEPFTTASGDPLMVLLDTVAGLNDEIISGNARIIKQHAPQLILVRFAYEMELVGNYPWSQTDYELYIKTFQRYVDIFREEEVDNVQWIWSPAGTVNARPYYPGSDYIDFIGVSVLGFEDWDRKFGYERGRSFQSIFNEREWLEEHGKPIIITELGVAPSADRDEVQALKYQYE